MRQACRVVAGLVLACCLGWAPRARAQQAGVAGLRGSVDGVTVRYSVTVCAATGGQVGLFYDRPTAPQRSDTPDATQSSPPATADACADVAFVRNPAPVAAYRSWARLGDGAVLGPVEVCVGPDLQVSALSGTADGAAVTLKARVCNVGSQASGQTRVAFWPNHASPPGPSDPGSSFEPLAGLAVGACKDVEHAAGTRPNGNAVAWAAVDRGALAVAECREANNLSSALRYGVYNADPAIGAFRATVDGTTIRYELEVCNRGDATVPLVFVDLYYDDRGSASAVGRRPGDQTRLVSGLAPKQCVGFSLQRDGTPAGSYRSSVLLDADQLVAEPDEVNNASQVIELRVGGGGAGAGGADDNASCVDLDRDGVGVGPACAGVPDCNDRDAAVRPGAVERCGDGFDQDCDLTADDGCPGVACVDGDGDGFGVGEACALADPNDADPNVLPWGPGQGDPASASCIDRDEDGWGVGPGCEGSPDCDDDDRLRHPGVPRERCGNRLDDDCDLTVDDGCSGVACRDGDGDGWGAGAGCALADPDDANAQVFPYARCVDADGDGAGVGPDCQGPSDCDDGNALVRPGANEVCGNGFDDDCDLTVDDGCPGVACSDGDGDGWGGGAACVLQDCDDGNARVFPMARERCGDNDDDNCNGIADDGCRGRACVDRDGDGFGVGEGCPRQPDCDDASFATRPGVGEVCGNSVDDDCDGVIDEGCPGATDADGDGVGVGRAVVGQPDCDDSNPTRAPGRPELCGNGLDDDCDDTIDDGCPGVACRDGDGDGWGVGAACKVPDCRDDLPGVRPWASERCGDGLDNDCDGTVDDGCSAVACVDTDGDSWGTGSGCAKGDCNDADAAIHGWALEICTDGVDNNCNGTVDEGCLRCRDRDGDGSGVGPQCPGWDCNDRDPTAFPGADELCDLADNDCDGVVPPAEFECAGGGGEGGCSCRADARSAPSAWWWRLLTTVAVLALLVRRWNAYRRQRALRDRRREPPAPRPSAAPSEHR